MFLLFMGGFSTAIMKQSNYFYTFDSDSKDDQGLYMVGKISMILNFYDHREVEKYIQVFYLEYKVWNNHIFEIYNL